MRRRSASRLLAAIASATVAAGVRAAALEVRPGAVVRWPGAEIEECSLGERRWQPLPQKPHQRVLAVLSLRLRRKRLGFRHQRLASLQAPTPGQIFTRGVTGHVRGGGARRVGSTPSPLVSRPPRGAAVDIIALIRR